MQKSTSFLLPMYDIPYQVFLYHGIINTYLGDYVKFPKEEWGSFFYIMFKPDDKKLLESFIKDIEYVVDYYSIDDNYIMVKLVIPAQYKETIIKPFIKGKYSIIDRDYVKNKFQEFLTDGSPSINYLILTKSPIMRESIERGIGCSLPDDAEVWSIPETEDEIYKYPKNEHKQVVDMVQTIVRPREAI